MNQLEKNKKTNERSHLIHNAIFTFIFTFLAFSIAQFGLMTVVVKGYAYLGYAGCISLFIPMLIRMLRYRGSDLR